MEAPDSEKMSVASSPHQVRWLPLESNPDVMTSFLHNLGVSTDCSVTDVYGLDPELLTMVPQPVLAVLLLYPLTEKAVAASQEEERRIEKDGQTLSPNVLFIKQTIGNACGTIALMHAVGNNQKRLGLSTGPLPDFFSSLTAQSPAERAVALQRFEELEAAHESAGHEGQTETPSRDLELNTHFIAFIHAEGHLYELDGRRPFAVNHGASSAETLLQDAAIVIQRFMQRDPTQVNFSVLALTGSSQQ